MNDSPRVARTLDERGKAYGDYEPMAQAAQTLKGYMRSRQGWEHLDPYQRESLDMIATKIARILTGDPNKADSWHDIAGYAILCEERCPTETP